MRARCTRMKILNRIKSWFTPRNTAQEIIKIIRERGPLREAMGCVYIPVDPVEWKGVLFKIHSLGATEGYLDECGTFVCLNLAAVIVDPKPETPFVPQLPLL